MKAALVPLNTSETFNQTFGMLQKACRRQGSMWRLQQPAMLQQLRFRISDIQVINIQDLTPEDLASTPPKLAAGLQQSSPGDHRSWRDTLKLPFYLKYRPCLFIIFL